MSRFSGGGPDGPFSFSGFRPFSGFRGRQMRRSRGAEPSAAASSRGVVRAAGPPGSGARLALLPLRFTDADQADAGPRTCR
jgi:hypothetical protein